MKIVVVVGTRPEVIKLAPVIRALRARKPYEVLVCSTAQHDAMLEQTLANRKVLVDYELPGRTAHNLDQLTSDLLDGIGVALERLKPRLLVVQGDTTSALCGALAAFYRGIPVAHVEAGLRTSTPGEPFPEEMNRRLISRLARLHFAPTRQAYRILLAERVDGLVETTGNTVVDELALMLREEDAALSSSPPGEASLPVYAAQRWTPYLLVTCHRREALESRIKQLVTSLIVLMERRPDLRVVWPMHANPVVRAAAQEADRQRRIHLMDHLPYSAFFTFLRRAALVVTDSGGVVEEAVTLGRRLIIIRDETERREAITLGGARLVMRGEMPELPWIVEEVLKREEQAWSDVFGDGRAGERIAAAIDRWAQGSPRVGW